jgi:tetratricopeptide (TPR) repeat protein
MVSGEFPASPPAPPGAAEGSAARWQFFISYTGADRAWAEWIAWQLEDAGYTVLVQAWDFVPGSHWTSRMDGGTRGAERTLAVLSRAYLASVYGRQEWEAAFRGDPEGFARKLVPVRVEDCPRPGLLGGVVSIDLFGLPASQAKNDLLEQIRVALAGRAKPAAEPAFPSGLAAPAREPPSEPPAFPGGIAASPAPAAGRRPTRPGTAVARVASGSYELLTAPCGLVGRTAETGRLAAFTCDSAPDADRVLVIRALGGMGKSALAWDFLHRSLPGIGCDDGPEGVVWWSFEDGGVDALLAAVSQLSGTLPGAEHEAGRMFDRALAAVRTRRVLIVLDSLERQLGAYSSMHHRPMLESESGRSDIRASERRLVDTRLRRLLLEALTQRDARVIVTTRLMPEELEAAVGVPRRGVALLDLAGVPHTAADELLASLGTPADTLLRSEIDRAAGGNPLILQAAAGALASSRVDPASLVSAVAWDGMPPEALDDMSAARAGVMRLVLSRLDEGERAVAGAVAAFAEPPTTTEVRRVVERLTRRGAPAGAAVEGVLGRLGALLLVAGSAAGVGGRRWAMHPVVKGSVRSLAGATQADVLTAIRDEFADAPHPDPQNVIDIGDLRPQVELFNVLCDLGQTDDAARLYLRALNLPLMRRLQENARRLELVGRLFPGGWRQPPAVTAPDLRMGILNEAALTHQWLGQNKLAAALVRDAIRVATPAGGGQAVLSSNLASILLYTDELEDACGAAVAATRLAAQAGDTSQMVVPLFYLALTLRQTGRPVGRILDAIDEVGGGDPDTAWTALRRGDLALWDGQADLALEYAHRSHRLANAWRPPYEPSLIEASRLLGQALLASGRPGEALPHIEDALRRAERFVLVQEELPTRVALAQAVCTTDPHRAEKVIKDGFDHRDPLEYRWFAVDALAVLAALYERDGRRRQATDCRSQLRSLAARQPGWDYVLYRGHPSRSGSGPAPSSIDERPLPRSVTDMLDEIAPTRRS